MNFYENIYDAYSRQSEYDKEDKELRQIEENATLLKEEEDNDALAEAYAMCNPFNFLNQDPEEEAKNVLKKDLFCEALFYLFDKCCPRCAVYEQPEILKRHLVTKFVDENGYENLMDIYSTRSYLLSEMVRIVNETTEELIEKNGEEDIVSNIDKQDFYKKLSGIEDLELAQAMVKDRVGFALNKFNLETMEKRKEIENSLLMGREKLANEMDFDIKEEVQLSLEKERKDILENEKGILETMVYNIQEAAYTNKDVMKAFVNESGGLDMDKVMDQSLIMYSFLEMMNTCKLCDVTEEFLLEEINSFN